MTNLRQKGGFTLPEAIIYVAVLAIVSVLVVQVLMVMSRSFLEFRIARAATAGGTAAMERVIREVRWAASINVSDSLAGSHPGRLTLRRATGETVVIYAENNQLYIIENNVTSSLLPARVSVTDFRVWLLDNSRSEGVKIELAVESGQGQKTRQAKYYSSAILKDSYNVKVQQ
jgi:type II secretory pathway pseudopilin PulG